MPVNPPGTLISRCDVLRCVIGGGGTGWCLKKHCAGWSQKLRSLNNSYNQEIINLLEKNLESE